MSADNSLKNWQVEEGGKGGDRYALSGTQTEAPKQLQLQEDASGGAQWQPIDYRRQTGPRRNWILPSVVIVALLGVLSYVGWIAFGQVVGGGTGNNLFAAMAAAVSDVIGGQAATAPTPEAIAAAATLTETVAVEEPTATVVVTATPIQEPTATATPEPPPPAQAELITGIITEAAGVNARREPSTTAEVVRLLAQNSAVTVVAEQDGWLQVILDDNTVAWVSADFIERTSQTVLLDRLNEILTAAGLPPVATPTPAVAVAVAESTGLGATLPAVVIGEPDINARNAPDMVNGVTVMTLQKDTAVTVVGRNGDNQWLAVALPDEEGFGWVMTQFVSVQGDIATLGVVTPEQLTAAATAAVAAETESAPLALVPTATSSAPALPVLEVSPVAPPAPFTNTLPLGAAVAISNPLGVNARATASADGALVIIVPNGAVLPAVGRSADDQWIQVRLPDNQLAWMARTVINVSDNIDTAPVGGVDTAAATDAAPAADATATPATTPAAALAPGTPADAAIATITNQLGANLRSVPDRNANPVITVDNGERFPAIGRTADSEWVQLALPDGTTAWALLGTVSLDTDVNSLPIIP
jgi:uncharacterized protein YgiM (DUF1202 family)